MLFYDENDILGEQRGVRDGTGPNSKTTKTPKKAKDGSGPNNKTNKAKNALDGSGPNGKGRKNETDDCRNP